MSVRIESVDAGSVCEKHGIKADDVLISINGNEIMDVLDYQFYATESKLLLEIERNGKKHFVSLKKKDYEDLGLNFCTYLMDEQKPCRNKCVFCFIDQLPKGLRDSLYFKDDDSRLSFLFGNYITLTNISEHEVDRIIKMHISPINISVHTTNPKLRNRMMHNRFAGDSLKVLYRLAEAGTKINCQLVLCPGWNDGDELKKTLDDLTSLYPSVQSIAAVPLGMTKFRDGLEKLTPYNKESARATVSIIEDYGDKCLKKYGTRIVYAADEFYLKAELPMPDEDYYEEYAQLDNGVGMCTLLKSEFVQAVNEENMPYDESVNVSIATGTAAYPLLCELVDIAKKKWHNLNCKVFEIKNNFFGESITVSGLVTGGDLISQLKNQDLGNTLLLPSSMFRAQGDIMLDDTSVNDIETALNVRVRITQNDGFDLLSAILNGE